MAGLFTINGGVKQVTKDGSDTGIDADKTVATGWTATLTCSYPKGVPVPDGVDIDYYDIRTISLLSDGTITEDGTHPGISLPAHDPTLFATPLQWTIKPGPITLTSGKQIRPKPWTFNALLDGQSSTLSGLAPVVGMPLQPAPASVPWSSVTGKPILAAGATQAEARAQIDVLSNSDADWITRHAGHTPVPAARITYYDKPDTAFANLPTVMDTGQEGVSYADNGTEHPIIVDGGFQLPRGVAAGQSFEYTYIDATTGHKITRVGATFKVNPSGGTTNTWALAIATANGPFLNAGGTAYRIGMHLTIGRNGSTWGWGLSKASNATGSLVNTFLTDVHGVVCSGFLLSSITEDDNAEYTVEAWIDNDANTIYCILPDGQLIVATDSDVGTWSGQYGYVELVMVARDTDPTPIFTEFWYDTDANPLNAPGQGGLVTRDVMDGNTKPKLAMVRGTLGGNVLQIGDNANAANYAGVANRAAGSPPYFYVGGADADIHAPLVAKGKGRPIDGTSGRPFAQVADGAAPVTTGVAPTRGRITRYNCTPGGANLNVALPALSTLVDGDTFPVEKYRGDASAFTITFTAAGTDRFDDGTTSTAVLKVPGQISHLQAFSIGGALYWKTVYSHVPLSSEDARYLGIAATAAAAAKLATPIHIDGVPFDGSVDIGTGLWTPAASGFAAWSEDPALCYIGAPAFTAGILVLRAVLVPLATTITNVVVNVTNAGAGLTTGQNFAGLWQGGARLGVTADQSTNWQTTGLKITPLAGGPVAVAPGLAYVGAWVNGTTKPQFAAPISATLAANIAALNANGVFRSAFDSHTGLTTAGPPALGALTGTTPYWVAIS
jgi:hypothetical protein